MSDVSLQQHLEQSLTPPLLSPSALGPITSRSLSPSVLHRRSPHHHTTTLTSLALRTLQHPSLPSHPAPPRPPPTPLLRPTGPPHIHPVMKTKKKMKAKMKTRMKMKLETEMKMKTKMKTKMQTTMKT